MATVFQKCKTDPASPNYPCEGSRCGHPWTVRYREPGGRSGRQREKTFAKKTGPTGADAFAVKVENDKGMGVYIDPKLGAITVKAWALDWLKRQVVGGGTRRGYEGLVTNWIIPNLGRKTLAGLTREDVERLVVTLQRSGLAASTINNRIKVFRMMLNSAVAEKRVAENPAKDVKLPRAASSAVDDDEIPSLAEVDALADHIAPHYRLTIYLQAALGLRISEALAYSVECRREDVTRVRWQVSADAHKGKTTFVALKHRVEGEYRDIPTPPLVDAEIDLHLATYGTTAVTFTDGSGRDHGLEVLFAPARQWKGTMPTAATYGYHFRKACKVGGLTLASGEPKYHPHSLRHFFASTALANGIPVHEVSQWLGHKSIQTTVDIYGHLLPEAWGRFREVMQQAMRPT